VVSRRRFFGGLLAMSAAVVSCSKQQRKDDSMNRGAGTQTAAGSLYFPDVTSDAWETTEAAAAGWREDALQEAVTFAKDVNSTGLIILYQGRIAREEYWRDGGTHVAADCFSVQKSLVSLLAGFARYEGHLDIERAVSEYIGPGWSRSPNTEARITVRHLMTMTSGLTATLERAAEPGSVWAYNTAAYQVMKPVIEKAAGEPLEAYTRSRIWERIGASDSAWQERPNSPFTGWAASTRDMARFGLLVLAGGRWGDQVVFPDPAYLQSALSTSQQLNLSYGLLWWLNGKESHITARGAKIAGALNPQAPPDLVQAAGAGDKRIYVVPSRDLVVARHGPAASTDSGDASSSFDSGFWSRLSRAFPA
jgi:CubicO group peptidase (beta-lactamase class C family)